MVEVVMISIFAFLLFLGIIYAVLSYLECRVTELDKLKKFLKYKFISICVFVVGILVHTFGDLSVFEMEFETAGHFIIMAGAIVLIKSALDLTKVAEEYGYD
jgi:hypothetical protein